MAGDTIFMLGEQDTKLCKLLSKLGYRLRGNEEQASPADIINSEVIDLIVVNSRADIEAVNLCQYLRSDEVTKKVPIVYLASKPNEYMEIKELNLEKLEIVKPPYSIGTITSRIATHLRMRKMDGAQSSQASLAEMNAALRDLNERFKKEREQARAIQLSLLPRELPKDPRFELAVTYQPLDEVGGDWYFVNATSNQKWAIQIADVTGHGLSAAFIGSMTKLAMAAAAREKPNELLQEMNRLMAPQIPEGRFVTMESCVYDPATGALEFARAGHPPGLVLHRAEGRIEELLGDGFALGFFEEGEYSLVNSTLAPGDVLVLLTDGIPEAQNRNAEQYGQQRLNTTLLEIAADWSANKILDHILAQFKEFTGGRLLKDDVTLLVLKRVE